MSYLELKDIHKSYYLNKNEFKVLKGISLNFDKGEFVSILGESGGGKSTLLNIIGGLDHKYDGDVVLQGKSLKDSSEKQLDQFRSQTVGFIFQSFNLISHLTNLENVMVPLEMTNLSRKAREKRAEELLGQVGLTEHIHKHPNQLSGGQKQRVAIARALAADPDIIIADEPTGALDSQNTEEVLKILEDIAKDDKLVICVTHSEEVASHGTRIVRLVDGKVAKEETLSAPYERPEKTKPFKPGHLSFGSAVTMALQHMRYNLKRNLLIIFGVAIGIFSVIVMLGLGRGVQGYINDQIGSEINPNTIQVAKYVDTDSGETPGPTAYDLKGSDITRFKKIKNVTQVEKGYFANGVQAVYGKKNATISLLQTMNKTQKTSDIKTGHAPGANEVLLTKSTAKILNKANYKAVVGKTVTVRFTTVDSQNQPVSLQQDLKVSGIISSGYDAIAYNTLAKIYQDHKLTLQPNFAAVTVNDTTNVKAVQNKIKAYDTKTKGKTTKAYTITGAGAILDTLNTYISLASYVLAAIAGISLLVSAIMIIVVLYISVSERTKEIGILRAIGARKKDVRHLFTSEAFFLGLFGSIFGALLAGILAYFVNPIAVQHIHSTILQITPGYVIFGVIVSVLISLLAALAPSRKAARIDPIESLSAD
ncbi:MAG: ATP-binding cassette domain-containing protein [Lactobacillus sp.]|nr:ATP-binding cassette domain-containing protein [Lactobacillus sp.]